VVLYFIIKKPVNAITYSTLPLPLAFFVSLIFSFFITKYTSKSLEPIFKNIEYNSCVLNIYVLDSLVILGFCIVDLVVIYFPPLILVSINAFDTMPRVSNHMIGNYNVRRHIMLDILRKYRGQAADLKRLEIIATSMDKDRSDPKHGGLHDVFTNYVNSKKQKLHKELHDKYEDGFAASAILDNHNRAIFG
jgi:hypothetical protein